MKNTDKLLLLLGIAVSSVVTVIFFDILLSKANDETYPHMLFFGLSSVIAAIFLAVCATLYLQNKLYLFRKILTNANDAVVISDAYGKILWQNSANAALSGYDDIKIKNTKSYFYIGDAQITVKDELDKISHFSGLFKIQSKNGKQNVWISAFKVSDELDNTICYVEIKRELSEFVKLLESTKSEKNKLQSQLHADYLTNVLNRKGFLSKLDEHIQTDFAHKSSIVFIDIDKFKQINDSYGHNIGDEVLKAVANVLKRHTRENDIVARWGGEEFVLLLNADIDSSLKIAQHLRQEIEKLNPSNTPVTCSFGISALSNNINKSIADADSAMYVAKKSGRNRVVIFENNNQNS